MQEVMFPQKKCEEKVADTAANNFLRRMIRSSSVFNGTFYMSEIEQKEKKSDEAIS